MFRSIYNKIKIISFLGRDRNNDSYVCDFLLLLISLSTLAQTNALMKCIFMYD